jgi:hypothetical protein
VFPAAHLCLSRPRETAPAVAAQALAALSDGFATAAEIAGVFSLKLADTSRTMLSAGPDLAVEPYDRLDQLVREGRAFVQIDVGR